MAYQKKYFYWFLLSCVVMTTFSGCAGTVPVIPSDPLTASNTVSDPNSKSSETKDSTPIPVTKNIINRVMEDNDKKPNDRKPMEFQYYISKKVTLTLAESNERFSIESGELIITKQTKREQVTIAGNLPGLIFKAVTATNDNGYLLEVHFEDNYRNSFIKFQQMLPGDDEKYFLFHDDKKIIKYGEYNYKVDYDGIEPPHLLIKMKSKDISNSDERVASGITLPS